MPPRAATVGSLGDGKAIERATGRRGFGQHDPETRVGNRFDEGQRAPLRQADLRAPLLVGGGGRDADMTARVANVEHDLDAGKWMAAPLDRDLVRGSSASQGDAIHRRRRRELDGCAAMERAPDEGLENRVGWQACPQVRNLSGIRVEDDDAPRGFVRRIPVRNHSGIAAESRQRRCNRCARRCLCLSREFAGATVDEYVLRHDDLLRTEWPICPR